jgi:hypothetical protein
MEDVLTPEFFFSIIVCLLSDRKCNIETSELIACEVLNASNSKRHNDC